MIKWTRVSMAPSASTMKLAVTVMKLAELERLVRGLLDHEATSEFDLALLKRRGGGNTGGGVRAVIQSRKFDLAVQLCLRVIGSGALVVASVDLNELTVKLVFEVCEAYGEGSFVRAKSEETIVNALAIVPGLRSKGYTALNVAVEKHLMELLLVHVQMDSPARDNEEIKRPIDLVGKLSGEEIKNKEVKRILALLDQRTRMRESPQGTNAVQVAVLYEGAGAISDQFCIEQVSSDPPVGSPPQFFSESLDEEEEPTATTVVSYYDIGNNEAYVNRWLAEHGYYDSFWA